MSETVGGDILHARPKIESIRPPLPRCSIDYSGIPQEIEELSLLGLTTRTRNSLKRRGIFTIQQANDVEDRDLLSRGNSYIGNTTVQEVREKLSAFREELLSSTSRMPSEEGGKEPIVAINAKQWLAEHHLTWSGTSKTSSMENVERFVGDLGIYLYYRLRTDAYSVEAIAREIASLSKGEATPNASTLHFWLEVYRIDSLGFFEKRNVRVAKKKETVA